MKKSCFLYFSRNQKITNRITICVKSTRETLILTNFLYIKLKINMRLECASLETNQKKISMRQTKKTDRKNRIACS